jgi:STE24 endopeptidase
VAKARRYFTSEQIERGMQYGFERRLFMWGQITLHWALLLVLVLGGWARRLADFWDRRTGGRWLLTLLLVGATVYVAEEIVATPLRLLRLEHARAWGMSTRTLADWFDDYVKSFALGAAQYAVLLVVLFGVMWLWPRWWWAIATAVIAVLGMAYAFLLPVVINPLFNTFSPLKDAYLLRRFDQVANKAGVSVDEVLVMDASRRGKHTNAYFTGFGATRRIVVYDNLLKPYQQPDAADVANVVGLLAAPQGTGPLLAAASREQQRVRKAAEIESILAHEVGHWYHHHIYKGIALAALGALCGLFLLDRILRWAVNRRPFLLRSPTDPAAVPLVALLMVLATWAVAPAEMAVSRYFERQADEMSLQLAGQPEAFIDAEKRLVIDNLGHVAPSPVAIWFFASHPPTLERIEMAEAWEKAHGRATQP